MPGSNVLLVPCHRLEPTTAMSETTKPAAPSQAADEKEKAAPAPTPSLDPAPVANSKGEEPSPEAFRVSPVLPMRRDTLGAEGQGQHLWGRRRLFWGREHGRVGDAIPALCL